MFGSMVPLSFVTIVFGGEVREGGCAWPLCTLCNHRVTVDVGDDQLSLSSVSRTPCPWSVPQAGGIAWCWSGGDMMGNMMKKNIQ